MGGGIPEGRIDGRSKGTQPQQARGARIDGRNNRVQPQQAREARIDGSSKRVQPQQAREGLDKHGGSPWRPRRRPCLIGQNPA